MPAFNWMKPDFVSVDKFVKEPFIFLNFGTVSGAKIRVSPTYGNKISILIFL